MVAWMDPAVKAVARKDMVYRLSRSDVHRARLSTGECANALDTPIDN